MASDGPRKWQLVEERNRLTKAQVLELFMRQDGKCPCCGQQLQTKGHQPIEFTDEHVAPLWRGGSNELKNRELWCRPCSGDKTKVEATDRAKMKRVRAKHIGLKDDKPSAWGKYRRKMDGTIVCKNTGKIVKGPNR